MTVAGLGYLILALWSTRDFMHFWQNKPPEPMLFAPNVTILKPVKGVDPRMYAGLLSHCQQVVRAYDRDGRIADGVLVNDGEHAMTVIGELLLRPDVTLAHLRNVGYGCYNFAVRRGRISSPAPAEY